MMEDPNKGINIAEDELLSIERLCQILGISRRTLEVKRKEGLFPEPCTYVFQSPRWTIRRINHWLNDPLAIVKK